MSTPTIQNSATASTDPTKIQDLHSGAPAEDWAADAANALKSAQGTTGVTPHSSGGAFQSVTQSSTQPGLTSGVVGPGASALDTSAKSQSQVDRILTGQSSVVSTPGNELPGAWNDKPASGANTVYNDATAVLASAGQAAYNILPDSVKGVFGGSPTATSSSPITTTTNTTAAPSTTTNLSQTASNVGNTTAAHASNAASVAGEYAGSASNTAATHASKVASVTGEYAGSASNTAGEYVRAVPATASNAAGTAAETASNAAGTVAETASGAAATAAELAAAAAATAAATASNAYGKAVDTYNAYGGVSGVTGIGASSAEPSSTTATNGHGGAISDLPRVTNDNLTTAATFHATQTLPTQETSGNVPSSGPLGGVGSLVGGPGEEGVAVLPEEKVNPDPLGDSIAASSAKKNTEVISPYNKDTSAYAPGIMSAPTAPGASSTQGEGIAGKAAGVAGAVGAGGAAAKLQQREEQTQEKKEVQHEEVAANETTSGKPSTTEKAKEKVAPHHDSSSHPTTDTSSSSSAAAAPTPYPDTTSTAPPTTSSISSHSAASNDSPTSSHKKPSMMDKIKGEVKILSGKMGKNHEKIEEGTALKTGSSV